MTIFFVVLILLFVRIILNSHKIETSKDSIRRLQFHNILKGMTHRQVSKLVGKPYERWILLSGKQKTEYWRYSNGWRWMDDVIIIHRGKVKEIRGCYSPSRQEWTLEHD